MKKALIIFLLLLSFNKVYAYENKYFKLNIPEDFKEEEINSNTYKWISTKNSHEYLIITVSNNSATNRHNVKDYNSNDIKNYEEYMEKEINNQLKDYNLKVDVTNVKKEKINDLDSITYDVFWPTKESVLYDTYQKGYSFTTDKYIYVYTFTSDKQITNENVNYKKTLDSLELLDTEIEEKGFLTEKWQQVLLVSVIFGTLGAIFSLIFRRK